MTSCNNQFVLSVISRRCSSKRPNVNLEGWLLIGRGIVHLFLLWGFSGALVLAKPASLQRNAHGMTAAAATDLKADRRLEGTSSPSHKLGYIDFETQPENGIRGVAVDSEMKSTAARKGLRDLEVWEGEFELEQDKLDAAEDMTSIFGTNSKPSQNHKARREHGVEKGRPDQNKLVVSATSDLKTERDEERKAFQNSRIGEDLIELPAEDFDEASASHRDVKFETETDIFRNLEAMEDAFQLRVNSLDEEVEETGSGSVEHKPFNGRKTKRDIGDAYYNRERNNIVSAVDQRRQPKRMGLLNNDELVQISHDSTSTQRQDLKSLGSESGSQVKHRRMKNDPAVNSTTANGRHHVTIKSKVKSFVSAPGSSADAVPSSDSDKLLTGKSDDAFAKPKELEMEEADENEQERNLIPEYSLGDPITNWDRERQQWLEDHPEVRPYADDGRMRLFILTGTQPWPCMNNAGDHLLLRFFKNKVDYCRIHGIDIFYNMALLHPDMPTFWAKLPVARATMLSHPEVEWIWWLDADAIITDMEFEIPLEKYEDYNMVVHGWESLVYEKKSWVSLNAGSFLIRNCQWSLDFMERWASMGPQAPLGEAYKDILSDELPDRPRNPTDDQAALVFLLNAEKERWAGKVKVEVDYFLNGYFVELIDGFEAWEKKYKEMEKEEEELVEMVERGEVGKEKLVKKWGRAREKQVGSWGLRERRPFITHFTGCQPCSGHKNPGYSREQCHDGMVRALNYGDDQVLRALGFKHTALHLSDLMPSAAAAAA